MTHCQWDSEVKAWGDSTKRIYYWSELTASISEDRIDLQFFVYPNPITDFATIVLSDANQVQRIELIDIKGRTIRTVDDVYSNFITHITPVKCCQNLF